MESSVPALAETNVGIYSKFSGFKTTGTKLEDAPDVGDQMRTECMHGCNGLHHFGYVHQVYYRRGEVVFAKHLALCFLGFCDRYCGPERTGGFIVEVDKLPI